MVEEPSIEPSQEPKKQVKEIITEGVTPVHDKGGGYVEFEEKLFQRDALKELRPDLFSAKADVGKQAKSNFGTTFPKIASKGDIFVRVDVLPNRVYKFDGRRWIEINKSVSKTYLTDTDYLEFLVGKIQSGEYDLDSLDEDEREYILEHLKNQNS